MDVDHEIKLLKETIVRLGQQETTAEGKTVHKVKFGVLFNDEQVADTFEALVGTLRAAKKRGVVGYEGQMLLSPMHDDVDVVLYEAA